ncbi:MAG: NAD(P)-dependent oxidoreductase [Caldicoprobacterales bacterium]|jgi:3-hydroxyisobutyrate dehydrogenase-like beta-hydroxyacid dehydrogenase|nr:NAD(P)-dependent oxidoreductase [Clostridiales bacterium]
MKRIGFIGIGVMGKSMVRNLMKKGFSVSIYTRTKSKALDVIEEGAVWCDSIAQCVRDAEVVITIVGYPKDVEEVYFGKDGILENAASGTYLIDMTTTSPKLSKRIYDSAADMGMHALDAPVTGGDIGARDAKLSIMVGGDQEAYDICYPIFKALGSTIVYAGPAGFGQHTKMANQIAIAGAISGVSEALTYGRRFGLNLQSMLDSISTGSAGSWQMSNMAPRILQDDYAAGFYMKHFIKDMTIAMEEAEDADLSLVILRDVLNMYKDLADKKGLGDLGTQALIKYYDDESNA